MSHTNSKGILGDTFWFLDTDKMGCGSGCGATGIGIG